MLPNIDLQRQSILRVSINKNWNAEDFSHFFNSINTVYKSKFWIYKSAEATSNFISNPINKNINFLEFAHSPLAMMLQTIIANLNYLDVLETKSVLFDLSNPAPLFDTLIVKRIQYASPGVSDFFGISGILKEIKETLMYYFQTKKIKKKLKFLSNKKLICK